MEKDEDIKKIRGLCLTIRLFEDVHFVSRLFCRVTDVCHPNPKLLFVSPFNAETEPNGRRANSAAKI